MKSIFPYSIFFILFWMSVHAQQFKIADGKDIALFPQQNDFRNTLNLSGIWKFKKDSLGLGEKEKRFDGLKDSRSPFTASIRDITINTGFHSTDGVMEVKVEEEGKAITSMKQNNSHL